jgi:hypothetical protein
MHIDNCYENVMCIIEVSIEKTFDDAPLKEYPDFCEESIPTEGI